MGWKVKQEITWQKVDKLWHSCERGHRSHQLPANLHVDNYTAGVSK